MITPIFNATIENGKPILFNPQDFKKWCQNFEGKKVEVVVRRKGSRKSNLQNKYYRGVIVKMIAEETGYSHERAHGELQLRFFMEQPEDGSTPYIRSTRLDEWKTIEWEEKMTEIRQWAYDFLEIDIPKPNESDY